MQILFRFMTLGLAAFSLFYGACSSSTANSIENKVEGISYPTQNSRVTRGTIWQIPSTKDTRVDEPEIESLRSATGKLVKVKIIGFTPKNDVHYKEDPPPGVVPWIRGELKLMGFVEYSVHGKIYLYKITAHNCCGKTQNIDHEEWFSYEILDDDGDGKFETVIDGPATVLIPKWVTG